MKYLEAKAGVASGHLVIKGTRIRVAQLLRMIESGVSYEEIHKEWWPHLSIETLRGAVDEAIQHVDTPHNAETLL